REGGAAVGAAAVGGAAGVGGGESRARGVSAVVRRPRVGGESSSVGGGPVAVVGVSGRFAGARSVDELWGVLSEGRCVVGEVGEERGSAWGVSGVRRRLGAVPGVAEFDPLFFEVSPREAEV